MLDVFEVDDGGDKYEFIEEIPNKNNNIRVIKIKYC